VYSTKKSRHRLPQECIVSASVKNQKERSKENKAVEVKQTVLKEESNVL